MILSLCTVVSERIDKGKVEEHVVAVTILVSLMCRGAQGYSTQCRPLGDREEYTERRARVAMCSKW
jgi:hypothetical protein